MNRDRGGWDFILYSLSSLLIKETQIQDKEHANSKSLCLLNKTIGFLNY